MYCCQDQGRPPFIRFFFHTPDSTQQILAALPPDFMDLFVLPSHYIPDRKEINEKEWRECWAGPFIKTWTGTLPCLSIALFFVLFIVWYTNYPIMIIFSIWQLARNVISNNSFHLFLFKLLMSLCIDDIDTWPALLNLVQSPFSFRCKEYVFDVILCWYLANLTIDVWIN